MEANAQQLAQYAAICQAAGLVPIVEPEILIEGSHDISTAAAVSARVISGCVAHLWQQVISSCAAGPSHSDTEKHGIMPATAQLWICRCSLGNKCFNPRQACSPFQAFFLVTGSAVARGGAAEAADVHLDVLDVRPVIEDAHRRHIISNKMREG